jgi:uracil phosphoribosyltransferase
MSLKNLIECHHPLLMHKLGYLRDKNTHSGEFRNLLTEMTKSLTYEAMRDWPHFQEVEIETPLAKTKVKRLAQSPVIVSIMRAGNGMLDGALSVLPFCSTGFIGIYRDKFIHSTVEYYFKMPEKIEGKTILLCDPLIATADTLLAAIERLKSYQVGEIRVLSVLISSKAIERINKVYPELKIWTLHVEKEMNEQGYLIPGLGDAGDRIYQTK